MSTRQRDSANSPDSQPRHEKREKISTLKRPGRPHVYPMLAIRAEAIFYSKSIHTFARGDLNTFSIIENGNLEFSKLSELWFSLHWLFMFLILSFLIHMLRTLPQFLLSIPWNIHCSRDSRVFYFLAFLSSIPITRFHRFFLTHSRFSRHRFQWLFPASASSYFPILLGNIPHSQITSDRRGKLNVAMCNVYIQFIPSWGSSWSGSFS